MKKVIQIVCVMVVVGLGSVASADYFGTGVNAFTIDFVTISGDASSANGMGIGPVKTFSDPDNDYRIGKFEITNDQWSKFKAAYGTVTGSPSGAYSHNDGAYAGTNIPTTRVSWYAAAQMVNWLNTRRGHHVAYKFTGTQGTTDYAFATWSAAEAEDGTNLYRHKDAFYYMPTEDEWVKAAYWNGTTIQSYATPANTTPVEDVDVNYGYEDGTEPWDIGSGSEELNGTFDMMGNVWEWMESPYNVDADGYSLSGYRGVRGVSFRYDDYYMVAFNRNNLFTTHSQNTDLGFRVASNVPEPATLTLLAMGGLAMVKRPRRRMCK